MSDRVWISPILSIDATVRRVEVRESGSWQGDDSSGRPIASDVTIVYRNGDRRYSSNALDEGGAS